MADIRINALATTAASTASDDFLAVDGAAQGTRKLNAFSPTFGGNLTVSGGTSTLNGSGATNAVGQIYALGSGNLSQLDLKSGDGTTSSRYSRALFRSDETSPQRWDVGLLASKDWVVQNQTLGGTTALSINSTNNAVSIARAAAAGTAMDWTNGTVTSAMYLQSSGTPAGAALGTTSNHPLYFFTNSSAAQAVLATTGNFLVGTNVDAANARLNVLGANNAGLRIDQGSYNYHAAFEHVFSSTSYTTEYARIKNNGNFLLGTTTDSANGRLQLATHTTSAGGIGFGTGLSLFTSSASVLDLSVSSGNPTLRFLNGTTVRGGIGTSGTTLTVQSDGGSIILASNATTALTLDSSQNATFAGKITAGTWASGTAEKLQANTTANNYAGFIVNTASTGNGYALRLHTNGTTSGDYPLFVSSGAGAGSLIFGITGDGNATFAGKVTVGTDVSFPAGGYGLLYGSTRIVEVVSDGININGSRIRISTDSTPATAGAAGTKGDIKWDASYIYVCTATSTWKRVAIATW